MTRNRAKNMIVRMMRIVDGRLTSYDETDVVGELLSVLDRQAALVDAFVLRPDVLNDQAPLVRPLVAVDTHPGIGGEREMTNGQRMTIAQLPPRDL